MKPTLVTWVHPKISRTALCLRSSNPGSTTTVVTRPGVVHSLPFGGSRLATFDPLDKAKD